MLSIFISLIAIFGIGVYTGHILTKFFMEEK